MSRDSIVRLRVIVATLAALSGPGALGAQVCLGKPSLADAPVSLGGAAEFIGEARRYGGEVVLGSRLFVSGAFTRQSIQDTEQSLKTLGATLAYEVPNDDATMCIGVSGRHEFGLEDAGADVTSQEIGPVLAVGVESELSPTVTMIQHGRLGWFWERITADVGPLSEEAETTDYGLLVLGVSLVFNRVVSIGPSVGFPFGVEGADRIYGLALTIGLGGSS